MKKSAHHATVEDLKKILELIKFWIAFWQMPENDPEANIVVGGNHKTGTSIPVFNLPMLITCGNCGACRLWCYVIKSFLSKLGNWMPSAKSVAKSVARNMVAIQRKGLRYFVDRMVAQIVKAACRFMRVHAQGDFDLKIPGEPDEAYMKAWAEIAQKVHAQTGCVTLAFTKEFDTLRKLIADGVMPNNPNDVASFPLQIVLSEWADELKAPEDLIAMGYHTSRAIYDVSDLREGEFLCPGNCETCGMCWKLNSLTEVTGTAFEVH